MSKADERLYFDLLRRIVREYQSAARLRRMSERDFGLPFEEVLEMAYENIQMEAAQAIRGKHRPKVS